MGGTNGVECDAALRHTPAGVGHSLKPFKVFAPSILPNPLHSHLDFLDWEPIPYSMARGLIEQPRTLSS